MPLFGTRGECLLIGAETELLIIVELVAGDNRLLIGAEKELLVGSGDKFKRSCCKICLCLTFMHVEKSHSD